MTVKLSFLNIFRTGQVPDFFNMAALMLRLPVFVIILILLTFCEGGLSASEKKYVTSNKSFFNLKEVNVKSHRRAKRSTNFDSADITAIVNRHNELRGEVSPEAADMKYMSWDDDLATMAQEWSDGCEFEHGNPTNISPFSSIGQNLWLGTGSESSPPDGTGQTQSWYNEVQYYTFSNMACSHVCGHYTQVVWSSSYTVGCGRTFCSTVTWDDGANQWNNAWLVTCNYGPAGNYAGTQPYTEGSSCTQCDSGVGQCYNNLCRLCSEHDEECVCNTVCQNCGTRLSNCTCVCQDGWYGSDCSTYCEDTHSYCWQNPGWPGPAYCGFHPAVPVGCPLMCSVCNAEDPDFVCDAAQASSESPSVTTSQMVTTLVTIQSTTSTCATLTCQNGGTFTSDGCECRCTSEYQGDLCQHAKIEVEHGVLIHLIHDIGDWSLIRPYLLDLVGRVVTYVCNKPLYFPFCCPPKTQKSNSDTLSYVDDSHVDIVSGYPVARDDSSYWVMVVVRPPVTSDLCTLGDQTSRRKRETDEVFLDQDTLYNAIQNSTTQMERELNVTVGAIERGEVEEGSDVGESTSVWLVLVILLVVLIISSAAVALVSVFYVFIKGIPGRKSNKVNHETEKSNTDSEKPTEKKQPLSFD